MEETLFSLADVSSKATQMMATVDTSTQDFMMAVFMEFESEQKFPESNDFYTWKKI